MRSTVSSPVRIVFAVAIAALAIAVPMRSASSAPRTRLAAVEARAGHVVALPFPASHLGVQWTGPEDADVELRVLRDGSWSPWQRLTVSHDSSDDRRGRVASGLVRADGATAAVVRLRSGGARAFRVVDIDAVRGRRVRGAVAAAQTGLFATTSTTAPPRAPQPDVITRAEWGADESIRKGTPEFAPLSKLIVHHTATANDDPDPASTVRAIYAYHVQSNGWNDIGYNFLIDAQGRTYEGRWARAYAPNEVPTGEDVNGRGVIGAHAEGANTGSVGVALLGTFTDRSPTPAAMSALRHLLAWKADGHDIDPQGASTYVNSDGSTRVFPNIAGHRDTKSTACPGDQLYAQLPAVRDGVAQEISNSHVTTPGYWIASRDGHVYPQGDAGDHGSMGGVVLNAPVVGLAATPTGRGYWELGADGGIFSFGDATFHGSTGGMRLNRPVIQLAATPTGRGYWLVASDGGIFAFGDARFYGSTGGMRLNKPVVGMAATPTGRGYWLVASDGGIFSFGDARFHGSTGSLRLNSPVVGLAAAPSGSGYWLVARDGGVFAFDVPFYGSVPGLRLPSYAGSAAIAATPASAGYYVLGLDGGIFTFGDARFLGSHPGLSGANAASAVALQPPARAAS